MTGFFAYNGVEAITPSDSAVFSPPYQALMNIAATASNAAIRSTNGDELTITAVQPGQIIPISVDQLKATGTTGTWLGLRYRA